MLPRSPILSFCRVRSGSTMFSSDIKTLVTELILAVRKAVSNLVLYSVCKALSPNSKDWLSTFLRNTSASSSMDLT